MKKAAVYYVTATDLKNQRTGFDPLAAHSPPIFLLTLYIVFHIIIKMKGYL